MAAELLAQQVTVRVSSGISAGLLVVIILLGIASYAYMAFCLMAMAKKTGTPNGWFAWIPILNIWLMCQIAGKDVLWFVLCLIPCVNIVVIILLYMAMAEALGFENWWGLLMIIPLVNYYVMYRLAFTEAR